MNINCSVSSAAGVILILLSLSTLSHALNLTGIKGYVNGHSGIELNCNFEQEENRADETVVEVVWRLNGLAFYIYKFDWVNNRKLPGTLQPNSCGLQVDESKSNDKVVVFSLSPGGPNGNGYYNCEIETRSTDTGASVHSVHRKYHQGAEVTVSVSGKGIEGVSLTAGKAVETPVSIITLLTIGVISYIICY